MEEFDKQLFKRQLCKIRFFVSLECVWRKCQNKRQQSILWFLCTE